MTHVYRGIGVSIFGCYLALFTLLAQFPDIVVHKQWPIAPMENQLCCLFSTLMSMFLVQLAELGSSETKAVLAGRLNDAALHLVVQYVSAV